MTNLMIHGIEIFFRKSSSSFIQEISRVLWVANVHYSVDKSLPQAPVLSIYQTHTLPFYFLKTSYNNILVSATKSSKRSLSIRFSH